MIGPEGRSPSGQCAVYSRVRVHLPEWRIHCHRARLGAGPCCTSSFGPPGGECRTILRDPLSAPRRRWDGRPVRCRDARIGPLPLSKGGPRHWQACGPAVRFSRLPASARWIGQALGPGLPAWAAPSRTSKRGCAVRSGLSHRDQGSGRRALLLYGDSERPARKHNDGRVALAAVREESPMTDLITAARQGNGPRVEVAPHMVVAEFRGLGQLACCCRSVASTRQRAHPGFMVAAFILASSHRVLCRSS